MTSRRNDPATSKEAAAMIQAHISKVQHQILRALARRASGLSTRELALSTGIDYATVTPRMRPMAEAEWVEMTEKKVKNPHGKGWGHVWVITPKGRGVLL
jgi:DNA-binding MarR family transcriptional regulator